jgi:hypothetical protein
MQDNAQICDGLKDKTYLRQRAGVCLRTVDSWVANNWVAYFKIGGRVLFSSDDIEAFLASHRVPARGVKARTHKPNATRKG